MDGGIISSSVGEGNTALSLSNFSGNFYQPPPPTPQSFFLVNK